MSSQVFIPTYLYIKQHSITGKLYFGKTCSKDPVKYPGSGTHWKNHIKKHGKEHVQTIWYCLFYDQESCTEFALNFSRQQNIVESENWLNQKEENGVEGGGVISEACRKAQKSAKWSKQPDVACPSCNKSGGLSNMKRYHFDNCTAVNPSNKFKRLLGPRSDEQKQKRRQNKLLYVPMQPILNVIT